MKKSNLKIAVIGTGNRGCKYLTLLREAGANIVAVADASPARLQKAVEIAGDSCLTFPSATQMLESGITPDAAIIATPERAHAADAMLLLDAGAHLLLEKPLATTLAECEAIAALAKKRNRIAGVCHVLRYHPYFEKLHELATCGKYGQAVSITHRINVGIDRACHTFVRGPWGDTAATSPMLLSKCCHDMDLLVWLTASTAASVASTGGRLFFRPENAPLHSADRCTSCSIEQTCPYSAVDLYVRRGEWTAGFDGGTDSIAEALKNDPYGRCVFRCGNTTVDRQAVVTGFRSGAIATLTMNLFTATDNRDTHICLTGGEIHGNGSVITVTPLKGQQEVHDFTDTVAKPFHAGADRRLILDFLNAAAGNSAKMLADIDSAIESHRICFAAISSMR